MGWRGSEGTTSPRKLVPGPELGRLVQCLSCGHVTAYLFDMGSGFRYTSKICSSILDWCCHDSFHHPHGRFVAKCVFIANVELVAVHVKGQVMTNMVFRT